MPFLEMPKGRLYYEVHGSGRPIVFIAGLGGVGSFWGGQIEHFSKTNRVIVFDHRGTGRSMIETDRHSVDLLARDTAELMQALDLTDATLVGHSTGGAIAQAMAIRDRSRLRDMVLSATWAHGDDYFRSMFGLRREILTRMGSEAYDLFGKLLRYPPWYFEDKPNVLGPDRVRTAGDDETVIGRIDALVAFDSRPYLSGLTLPTLVIGARDDAIAPAHLWKPLQENIPGAQSVVFETGGHFVPQTMPGDFNAAVQAFLENYGDEPADIARRDAMPCVDGGH